MARSPATGPRATTLLLVLALVALPAISASPPRERGFSEPVYLRTRALGDVDLAVVSPRGASFPQHHGPGVYLAQFSGPIMPETRQAVERIGDILWYLPDFAYVIRSARPVEVPNPLLEGLRWFGEVPAAVKVDPRVGARLATGPVKVVALMNPGASGLPAGLSSIDASRAQGAVTSQQLDQLARDPEVIWVEPTPATGLELNSASRLTKARQPTDGAYAADGSSMWSWNPGPSSFEGNTGSGATLAVIEAGKPDCSHADYGSRIIKINDYTGNGACNYTTLPLDTKAHGTVVVGTAAGNGTNSTGRANVGAGPGLSVFLGHAGTGESITTWCKDAWAEGARVATMSWGDKDSLGLYTSLSVDLDKCIRDADTTLAGGQQMRGFKSAGNEGPTAGTITPPGTAKNVITIGNGGNDETYNTLFLDRRNVDSSSARGPTADGRIKPDLVAPGFPVDTPDPGTNTYTPRGGTSISAPQAAGASTLVWQYHKDVRGMDLTPAALKAVLATSADLMCMRYGTITATGGYPSYCTSGAVYDLGKEGINVGGWGKVNAAKATFEGGSFRRHIENENLTIDTGEWHTYTFSVAAGTPLRLMVAWSDPEAAPNPTTALINDLNVELILDPNDSTKKWRPNNFVDDSYESQTLSQNSALDQKNNVEGFYLGSPAAGTYTVKVGGYNVPQGPQRYALVVTGDVSLSSKTVSTMFEDDFQLCGVGDMNGQKGWVTSTSLDPDLAACDTGDWDPAPLEKHLSVWSDSGLSGKAASAKHSFTAPTTAYHAEVWVDIGTSFNQPFSILELTGVLTVSLNAANGYIDVTDGSGTTNNVYQLDPAQQYKVRAELGSATASTYTLRVINFNTGSEVFSGTYSTAGSTAPSEIFLGVHSAPNDEGVAIFRKVSIFKP